MPGDALVEPVLEELLVDARTCGLGFILLIYRVHVCEVGAAEEGMPQQGNDYDCGELPRGGWLGADLLFFISHRHKLPSHYLHPYYLGVYLLFNVRALLHGSHLPTQSMMRYCRLKLAVDLATQ